MKEHLPKDGFEDFIKKRLEAFDEDPTTDMWSRIQPVIPPKPLPLWKTIWIKHWGIVSSVVALVGVSTLLILMYQQQSESEDLKQALKETNSQIEVLNEKVEQLNGGETGFEATKKAGINQGKIGEKVMEEALSKEDAGRTTSTNSQIGKSDGKKTALSKNKKIGSSTIVNQANQNKKVGTKKPIKKTSTTTNLFSPPLKSMLTTEEEKDPEVPMAHSRTGGKKTIDKTTTKEIDKKIKEEIAVLALLETLALHPLETVTELDSLAIEIDPINVPNDKGTYVFAFGQSQWGNTRMKRQPPNGGNAGGGNLPKFREKSKIGFGGGLQIGFNLSKRLSFGFGAGYNQTVTDFEVKHKIHYDKETEYPIAGNRFGNKIRPNFSTVLGDYTDDLKLTRSSDAVVGDHQLIELVINGRHDVRTVNLLGFAQYELFSLLDNKLTISAKGGVIGDFFIKHELKWNNFNTNVNGLELTTPPTDRNPPKPKEYASLNGFFSMPISYKVNDFVSVTLEPMKNKSVNTHRRGSLSFLKEGGINLQAGVTFAF